MSLAAELQRNPYALRYFARITYGNSPASDNVTDSPLSEAERGPAKPRKGLIEDCEVGSAGYCRGKTSGIHGFREFRATFQ